MSEIIQESYAWYQGLMAMTCLGLVLTFLFLGI